jgi:menaquinone-dependent protoporphyrinogen IX oxidase
MKILLLYKTVYGSTKEYALYIKKQIPEAETFDINGFDSKSLVNYDVVILGSRTYMGSIQGLKFLKDNWEVLKDKKVFLFTVGIKLQNEKSSENTYNMIPEEIRNVIEYIKVPGRIVYNKLTMWDKFVVNIVKPPRIDLVEYKQIDPFILKIKQAIT